jgi:hypothetical protein
MFGCSDVRSIKWFRALSFVHSYGDSVLVLPNLWISTPLPAYLSYIAAPASEPFPFWGCECSSACRLQELGHRLHNILVSLRMIWGSHSGGHGVTCPLGYSVVSSSTPASSGLRIKPNNKQSWSFSYEDWVDLFFWNGCWLSKDVISKKIGIMPSSGTLRRVAVIRIDFPEEHSSSITRVERIGELGRMLAVTASQRASVTSYC